MSKRTIYFPVYPAQIDFLDSPALLRGFVGGRGTGKSFIGAYDLLKRTKPNRLYLVGAPTYPMLRDATYRSFEEIARKFGAFVTCNKQEFKAVVRTWQGGTCDVLFRSGDNPDAWRGPNLSGAWMDEASYLEREAMEIVLGCLREGGEQGWLSATFTPKGRTHWTYEVFAKGGDGVSLTHARTSDNPFLPASFYETVKSQYGGLRALQELEGEFVDIEGAEWPAEFFGSSIWFEDWPQSGWRCKVVALDPSKGKDAKFGDYSAFVSLMVNQDGVLYVDADLAKRHIGIIVEQALEINGSFRPDAFGVEVNQFQEMLADAIAQTSQERGLMLPIVPIDNRVKKEVRIRRLTPYLSRGLIKFKGGSHGAELLVQQLRDFPEGEHDDGPDALEMAIRIAGDLMQEHEPEEDYLRTGF